MVENKTPFYPELVFKKNDTFPSIEIDINYIPKKYDGEWTKIVSVVLKNWIKNKTFSKKGTIWLWTGSSCNFHHETSTPSEFIVPLGFPKIFLADFASDLRRYFAGAVRLSDYVKLNDECMALYHVEDGRIFKQEEQYTFFEV